MRKKITDDDYEKATKQFEYLTCRAINDKLSAKSFLQFMDIIIACDERNSRRPAYYTGLKQAI